MSFIGATVLMQFQVNQSKGEWYDKVEVSIFMCPMGNSKYLNCATGDEATAKQISDVQEFINEDLKDQVAKVYVQSKEEVFKDLEKQYPGGNVEGVQLTPEEMQVIIRLKLVNPENYKIVAESLQGRPGVEEVRDQKELFEPVFNALNVVSVVSISLALIMLLTAILLIGTTIKLSSKNREDQIKIMRLTGASNTFIFIPFILEGMIAAVIGAIGAVIALTVILSVFINGMLAKNVEWMYFIGNGTMLIVGPLLLVSSIAISAISSAITLKKYSNI
jgi:cell division transport system permease protein